MVHMMIPVIFSIFVAILCAHHHTVYGQFPYNINENNNGAVPWWQRSASASVTANNGVSPFIGVYDTHQFALSCRPRPGCCCPQGPIRITAGNGDDKIEVSGTTVGGSACFGQTTLSGSFTQINPKLATYSIKVPIVGDLKFTLTLDASGNTLTLTPSGGSCPTVGYRISGNGSPSSSPTIPSSPYASPGAATSCTPMPTPYGLITPYGCTSPYATSVNPSYGNNGYNGYDGYNYNPYGNNPYSNGVSYNPTADRYSDIASASNQGGPFRPWGAGAGGAGSGAIQGMVAGVGAMTDLMGSIGSLGAMASYLTPPSAPSLSLSRPSVRSSSAADIGRPRGIGASISSSSLSNGERLQPRSSTSTALANADT